MEKISILKKGLNSNQLKIIAIIAMTIDHITLMFFRHTISTEWYVFLRVIGKITIPIMCFFISEGFYHTKNIKKYILRLFVFSIISHFAYCYAFKCPIIPNTIFFETSVIWSLFWGLIALYIAKSDKINIGIKIFLVTLISIFTIKADWGFVSVLVIVILGLTRDNRKKQMIWMSLTVIIYEIAMYIQEKSLVQFIHFGIFLSIPLLLMYNGEKGKSKSLKWFFYIYYPLHLFILALIKNYYFN